MIDRGDLLRVLAANTIVGDHSLSETADRILALDVPETRLPWMKLREAEARLARIRALCDEREHVAAIPELRDILDGPTA